MSVKLVNTIEEGAITFGLDGFFRVNGFPFFPIGISVSCYDNPFPSLADIKSKGFNMIYDWHSLREDQGTPDRGSIAQLGTNLTAAKNAGLMVIVCEALASIIKGYATAHGGYENYMTQVVNTYRDRDNILAWYVADEPDATLVPSLIQGCNIVHTLDAKHPVLLNFTWWTPTWNSQDWTNYADIGLISGYPVVDIEANVLLDRVERYTLMAKTLVKPGNPYGDWLQAWGSTEAHRYPTYAEERCMTWLAIASGAKMLPYWVQWSIMTAQMKTDLTAVVQEVNSLIPVILSTEVAKPTVSNSAVRTMVKVYDGETYVFAVNPMKTFNGLLTLDFSSLFSMIPDNIVVLGENRSIAWGTNLTFTDTFNYTNVHIYKISALPIGYSGCAGIEDVVTRTSLTCPINAKVNSAFVITALLEYQDANGDWLRLANATVSIYRQIGSGASILLKTGVSDANGFMAFTDTAPSTPATVKYRANFGGGSFAVYMSYSQVNQVVT